jgi:heat shock protein HslJ
MKTRQRIGKQILTGLAGALLVLFLAACAPEMLPVPGSGDGETPPAGDQFPSPVTDAQRWLAEQTGFTLDQVEIVSFDQEEWTDSCLGLGGPAEMCLQAITPGYRVVLSVNGQQYEVRTDRTGTALRSPQLAGMPGEPSPLTGSIWTLSSFIEQGSQTPAMPGFEPTLEFQNGGVLTGTGGCNQYGGDYSQVGSQIMTGELITTEMYCNEAGVMDQEQRFYQALASAAEFQLDGDELRIGYGDGTLVFTRGLVR